MEDPLLEFLVDRSGENSLNIALDYDGTFTRDPLLWSLFVKSAMESGHQVYVVTYRHPELDKIEEFPIDIPIIYTNGVAKREHVDIYHGLEIHVWIDDQPECILHPSVKTVEWLEEWRKTRE